VHDYDDPDDLLSGLSKIENWISEPNPTKEACDILWGRTPDFLLFGEADRTLESAYSLDEDILTNTPAALANLASIAELNLVDLFGSMQAGDIARRDTSITKANIRLNAVFAAMWKQSRLSVRLSVDGGFLRVGMWEAGDSITVFSERSAGLRMFVALVSFLRARDSERPPILLIDEAENHQHIDAQADLVNMFVTQEQAVKIIYTTHSPACLPPDLGSAIRSVVPRANNPQISDVKNSFWQGSAGYSPLMLAMGAAAAAFTPARCVVLAEGATEMILLPSLLRAATGERVLEYQVAPGLSEVPKDFYSQLDFEGAKVAYLLDGDGGGRSLAKGLVKAGVPKELIVILGAPGVENVLRPEVYGQAIATLLTECNLGVIVPELPELPEFSAGPWASVLSKWIEVQGLKAPSKVAIANWLIGKNKAEPSTQGADLLKATHESLMRALAR
jgi:hypothetical protein